jgi:hypothetical protein
MRIFFRNNMRTPAPAGAMKTFGVPNSGSLFQAEEIDGKVEKIGVVCLDDGTIWPKGFPTAAKSSNRGCRMTAERNFFLRWWGSSTIGYELEGIWKMSDSTAYEVSGRAS